MDNMEESQNTRYIRTEQEFDIPDQEWYDEEDGYDSAGYPREECEDDDELDGFAAFKRDDENLRLDWLWGLC